jgi:hypothetical protein
MKTQSIQPAYFSTGGFVLHKITGDFSGRCSAWFDKEGNIEEVEQIIPLAGGITKPVKKGGSIWEYCAGVGKRYVRKD